MKTLQSVLQGLPCDVRGSPDVAIDDVVIDSRKVTSGALFVALKGFHQDGHAFIESAVKAGARAVIAEQEVGANGVTFVRVQDSLKALAHVALRFWDNPSGVLRMVGITGTNGKTTTSYLVESIFTEAGWSTGVMGTINYRFGKDCVPAPNTTPFANELQRFLAKIVRERGKACVMEVSSHALELGRVEGVDFDVAVFTNLTQDHLDFHKTMEAYAAAKSKLFTSLNPASSKKYPKYAVINADDSWAETISAQVRVPILRYRLIGPADLYTKNLECDAKGSRFEMHTPAGVKAVRLPLLGDYNVMNALAAAGAAISQGVSLEKVVAGLEKVSDVPGRMERITAPNGFTVVIDYAHTEDALRQVMTALRKLKPKRLVTVFGCGGDRDRTKRPLMGQAAAEMSDEVIVTSDNPRSEDPARIALDVEVGVRRLRSDHYQTILDRETAIAKAFLLAGKDDIILIAGKGHENYQILADRTIPFDDREVARRLLNHPA
jgi:UDP-N-acetylmuramoyl-L-alanyl-D-glutamate--2,6-diaminopimelate ligase